MNKKDVLIFFDQLASGWDENVIKDDDIISLILDHAGVKENVDVLDVGCGTGVLFEDYLNRNVKSLTAIDLSYEMVKIAKRKYPNVNVICGDVEETDFDRQFDVVNVYNAFPHFPSPKNLIIALSAFVKKGGRLSIAHGMSREALKKHHRNASHVSIDLIDENELKKIMESYFDVDIMISNEQMYQVVGIKKDM